MLQTATTRDNPDHLRRHGRHRVMLSARLHTPQGAASVVLLDLSQGGAMLALPLPLPRGSHVVLMRGELEAHGTIVWAEGRRCGVAFDDIVPAEIIDRTIAVVAQSAH